MVFDELSLVLNACRNRFVPINRLPQDIMYYIFSIVFQLENIHKIKPVVSVDYPSKFVDQRGLLRLVSRIWNAFIVSTPEFWSLVDTTALDHKLLLQRIERAQQQELCVMHRSGLFAHDYGEQLAISLSSYLDRIRTLRLWNGHVAAALLRSSFPALRTLELRYHSSWFSIAQDRFPQLRTLHLSDCYLPLNATHFSTLRILHLHDSRTEELDKSLRFLSLCPELEELTIWSEEEEVEASSQSTILRLDKLRRLELRDLDTDCLIQFFRSARIPNFKRAIFTFRFRTLPGSENAFQEILGTIQFSSAGSGSVELSVFDDAVTCTTGDGRTVKVRPRPRFLSKKCADIFLDLLKGSVLCITVGLENQVGVRWLKQVFERNNVVDLRVRLGLGLGHKALHMSRDVVDSLAFSDEESEGQTEERMKSELELPLPSLQTLSFEDLIHPF